MLNITIIDRQGAEHSVVTADDGRTLMEPIRDLGTDDFALCSGSCSCATCHVYIDEAFVGGLPPISDDEDALLDSAPSRQPNSRLSCQIPLTAQMDGLTATIAAID